MGEKALARTVDLEGSVGPETPPPAEIIVPPLSLSESASAAFLEVAREHLELTDRNLALQAQRIEQLIKLHDQDRRLALQTLEEMNTTMELAQQMIAGLDGTLEKLGEATAALINLYKAQLELMQQEEQSDSLL